MAIFHVPPATRALVLFPFGTVGVVPVFLVFTAVPPPVSLRLAA